MKREIGCNVTANGWRIGGVDSSFNGIFRQELVQIGNGLMDQYSCTIGDIKDAYQMLKEKIEHTHPKTEEEIIELINQVVNDYFGNFDNASNRMHNYPDFDMVYEHGMEYGKVSNLKGQNAAMCVERAMLSQNLLESTDIDSYYKCSGILNNGKDEIHAYNIITLSNGKHYIYDSTIPSLVDEKITPIICEIPDYVYEKIISPKTSTGYAVETEHYAPLRNKNVIIMYDAGHQDEIYRNKKIRMSK